MVKAAALRVLVDADLTSWDAWNKFATEFANDVGARILHIDDGGITGRAFYDRARKLRIPMLMSPKRHPTRCPPDCGPIRSSTRRRCGAGRWSRAPTTSARRSSALRETATALARAAGLHVLPRGDHLAACPRSAPRGDPRAGRGRRIGETPGEFPGCFTCATADVAHDPDRHAIHHRRNPERCPDRDPLRGPRERPAGRVDPRLSAERELVGAPGARTAGAWPSRHHLRPSRFRPLEPADRRLRLRHLRRRPESAARPPRPP